MPAEIFRRSLGARLTPLLVAVGAVLALAGGSGWSLWTLAAVVVLALGALGSVMAFGDEVVADDDGLTLRNRLLGRQRLVPWQQMREVRVVPGRAGAPRVVFVFPETGPRLVLDALAGMDRLAALVAERAGQGGAPPL